MKINTLKEIIKKKENKNEFAIITNLKTGESEIYETGKKLGKDLEKYSDEIKNFYNLKKNGIIEGTEIFVETYIRPIKVIVVGAVHIAQYLVDFAKSLNFEISLTEPSDIFTINFKASSETFPFS